MNLLALVTKIDRLLKEQDSQVKIIPAAGAGVTVTAHAGGSYARGAWVELVPASTVTTDSKVRTLVCELMSAVDEYEIDIGTGGAGAEVVVSTHKVTALAANGGARVTVGSMATIPANTRVAVRIGCLDAVARTMAVSAEYIDSLNT